MVECSKKGDTQMKKSYIAVLVIVVGLLAVVLWDKFAPSKSEPSDWAVDEINGAIEEGLVTDSVRADYQANITREQFCEVVMLAYESISGKKVAESDVKFTDTDNSSVKKAAEMGIVKGHSEEIFAPEELITREQIAAMLVRMIDATADDVDVNTYNQITFADEKDISDWAKPSVNFAFDQGLITGVGENMILPQQNTTCEQAIVLAYRAVEKYKK